MDISSGFSRYRSALIPGTRRATSSSSAPLL